MATPLPFLDHPGPLAFAHRGGAAEAAENSWAAFEHAVSLGYRYMETDVRATADGVAVALHDPALDRVADRHGTLSRMTWAQVREAKLQDGRAVPLLEELLTAWPEVRWNIDVKTQEAVAPVIEVLRRTGAVDRVLVAAFRNGVQPRCETPSGRRWPPGQGASRWPCW